MVKTFICWPQSLRRSVLSRTHRVSPPQQTVAATSVVHLLATVRAVIQIVVTPVAVTRVAATPVAVIRSAAIHAVDRLGCLSPDAPSISNRWPENWNAGDASSEAITALMTSSLR